jgi:hypothetical protein
MNKLIFLFIAVILLGFSAQAKDCGIASMLDDSQKSARNLDDWVSIVDTIDRKDFKNCSDEDLSAAGGYLSNVVYFYRDSKDTCGLCKKIYDHASGIYSRVNTEKKKRGWIF